jgi:hypothetical protein
MGHFEIAIAASARDFGVHRYRLPVENIDHAMNEIHFSVETIFRNSICCIHD